MYTAFPESDTEAIQEKLDDLLERGITDFNVRPKPDQKGWVIVEW